MKRVEEDANLFTILNFDSGIFGFPVAKIIPDKVTPDELSDILSRLKKKKAGLVYWASDPNDPEAQEAARRNRGFLADEKVTFRISDWQSPGLSEGAHWKIEGYSESLPDAQLEKLAILVGNRYSRFRVDPRIPEEVFLKIYRSWIHNSVSGQIADAVLVIREKGKVVGMATIGRRDSHADIGLFAVDEEMHRRKLGQSLISGVQGWASRRGLKCVQSVTQKKNSAACALYEKCGFKINKIENFYHFWI